MEVRFREYRETVYHGKYRMKCNTVKEKCRRKGKLISAGCYSRLARKQATMVHLYDL